MLVTFLIDFVDEMSAYAQPTLPLIFGAVKIAEIISKT